MSKNLRIFLLSLLAVIFSVTPVFALEINDAYEYDESDPYSRLETTTTEGFNYGKKVLAELDDSEGESGDVVWEVKMDVSGDSWLKWKTDPDDSKILILDGVLPAYDGNSHGYTIIAYVSADIENPETAPEGYDGDWPDTIRGTVSTDVSVNVDVYNNAYEVGEFPDLVEITPGSGVDIYTLTSKYKVDVESLYNEGDDDTDPYDLAVFNIDEEDIYNSVSLPAWLALTVPARGGHNDDGEVIKYQLAYRTGISLPRGDREGVILVPATPNGNTSYNDDVLVGWRVNYTAPTISLTKPSSTAITMPYGTTKKIAVKYSTVKPSKVEFDSDKIKIASWDKPTATSGTMNVIMKPVVLSGDFSAKFIVTDDNDKVASLDFTFSITESIAVSPDQISWVAGAKKFSRKTLNLLTLSKPVRYEISPAMPDDFNFTVDSDDSTITLEMNPDNAEQTYSGKITFYNSEGNPAEVAMDIKTVEAISILSKDIVIPSGLGEKRDDTVPLANSVLPVRYETSVAVPADLGLEVTSDDQEITFHIDPNGTGLSYDTVFTFYDANGFSDDIHVKFTANMSTPQGTTGSVTTYPGAGVSSVDLEVGDNYGEVTWTLGDDVPSGINVDFSTETGTLTTITVYVDGDFADLGQHTFEIYATDEAGQIVAFTITVTVNEIPKIHFGEYDSNLSFDIRHSEDLEVSFDTVAPVSWVFADESDPDIENFVSFDVSFDNAVAGKMKIALTPQPDLSVESGAKDEPYNVIFSVTDANEQVVNLPLNIQVTIPSINIEEESVVLSADAASTGGNSVSKTLTLLADENSKYDTPVKAVNYEFQGDEPNEDFNFELTSDDSSVTFKITPSWPGLEYSGTVILYDVYGHSKDIALELEAVDPGEIEISSDISFDIPEVSIVAGESSNFTLSVPAGSYFGELSWNVGNLPDWLTVTPMDATGESVYFTVDVDHTASGNYEFTITVTDEAGRSQEITINVVVIVPELVLSNLPDPLKMIYGTSTDISFDFSGAVIQNYVVSPDISENVSLDVLYSEDVDSGKITLKIEPKTMADATYKTSLIFYDNFSHEPSADLEIQVVVPTMIISEDKAEFSAKAGETTSVNLTLLSDDNSGLLVLPSSYDISPSISASFDFAVNINSPNIELSVTPSWPSLVYDGAIKFYDIYGHSKDIALKIDSTEAGEMIISADVPEVVITAGESSMFTLSVSYAYGSATWTVDGDIPEWLTVTPMDATGESVSFTVNADNSASGNYEFYITVTDGAGRTQTYFVRGEVNVPELILSSVPESIIAVYDTVKTATFAFSGAPIIDMEISPDISENVSLDVSYPENTDSGTITVKIEPQTMADETYSTTVKFFDDFGHEPEAELNIQVIVPKLDIVEDSADISVNLGGSNSTLLHISGDYPASPIGYSASPEIDEKFGFSVTSNDSTITLISRPTEQGNYDGAIMFYDKYGNMDTVDLVIDVVSNEPLSITPASGTLTLSAGASKSITFIANEAKGTVDWLAGTLRGVTVNPTTARGESATFTITAGNSAVQGDLIISASDGTSRATATLNITVIPPESAEIEGSSINLDDPDVVDNLLTTLGLSSEDVEVEKLPDSFYQEGQHRSASDVISEVPSGEQLRITFPEIIPTESKVYVFAFDTSKYRKLFNVGEEIFVHMTDVHASSIANVRASSSTNAKLVNNNGDEVKTFSAGGYINVVGLMAEGKTYSTIITAASEDQEPPAPSSDDIPPLGASDGTCNSGFGILAISILGISFLIRKRNS